MFNFQNANRTLIEYIHEFHDYLMRFLLFVGLLVLNVLAYIIKRILKTREYVESENVEFLWTLLPALSLIALAIPSLRLLYVIDEGWPSQTTVKAQGHQWYWQYDYSGEAYDSYLTQGSLRLRQADNNLILPLTNVQVLVTSADVLHSWTVPTIAVKADAVPGRVNKLALRPKRPGLYYGQCREICGRNHRFIPISLECS